MTCALPTAGWRGYALRGWLAVSRQTAAMPARVLVPALCAAAIAAPALGQPRTSENADGVTIAVSRLVTHPDDMCVPEIFTGRIVARAFDRIGTKLTGVTLEYADGTREFVNVKIPGDLALALQGRVTQGLQRLSRTGRMSAGRVFRCGAAGRVLDLDTIR